MGHRLSKIYTRTGDDGTTGLSDGSRVRKDCARMGTIGAIDETNSLLVTFEVSAHGDGTLLRMTETGFREMGWEAAVLEQQYQEHGTGWDFYLPRLAPYAATLAMVAIGIALATAVVFWALREE